MTFLTPIWLLLLLPIAALAAAYVVVMRRRQRYAVRFASLPMLERVVPRRPGWRRHVPATRVLLAMTCLGLAAARPEMTLRLPYDRATVSEEGSGYTARSAPAMFAPPICRRS